MTSAGRPSRWARWRVDIRLARRQVWRTKGSSVLVVTLVTLPVLGLVGAAIVAQSHTASPAQQAGFELGQNQAWLQVVGGADPSRWQYVDQPDDWTVERNDAGEPANDEGPAPTDVSVVLPAGTQTLKVIESAQTRVETATGIGTVITTVGDVWRTEFAGRYTIISGAAPATADDAMVTPGLLTRLGATVGSTVKLPDASRSFTITGTLRRLDQQPSDQELFLPATAADVVNEPGVAKWFTPDWQPSFDQLTTLNHEGVTAYARTLVLHPPSGAPVSPYAGVGSAQWAWLMVGAVIAAFSGYLVVLLAGAAFAVAARRQQRSLAVAASVGATRSDVFRVVVMQGTVLGIVGGVLGAGLGAAGAGVFLAVTDRGVLSSFWGNWGYSVPWAAVIGVLLFATIVGTLAAVVPARTATHGDTVGALRGARRPAHLNPKRPMWGLLLMVAGFASTVAAGLALAGLNSAKMVDYDNPWRSVSLWAIVLSPIMFQVGVIVGGHWVLAMSSRLLSRLGLAARIASRDAAATPLTGHPRVRRDRRLRVPGLLLPVDALGHRPAERTGLRVGRTEGQCGRERLELERRGCGCSADTGTRGRGIRIPHPDRDDLDTAGRARRPDDRQCDGPRLSDDRTGSAHIGTVPVVRPNRNGLVRIRHHRLARRSADRARYHT
ncbi:FtsX-like permease family protein [Microbacterium sp.]|uniref:FtsX-like permease family protein n=1 Tax=Microbacterium sp. TaxID=51671 RepID=UPI003A926C18